MKKLEFWILIILYKSLHYLPLTISKIFSEFLSIIIQYVFAYRRQLVYKNLKSAFPEKSELEIKSIMRSVYRSFMQLWVELLNSWRLNNNYFSKNFSISQWQVVENALKEGKGLIVVSGHLGNFEWLAYYLGTNLKNLYAIMKKIRNPYVNDFIVKIREDHGCHLIYSKGALKKSIRILREGNALLVVGDQDAGKQGIFVDYFGRPASTATGAAILHIKTGAPVVLGVAVRRKMGQFDLFFERIPDFPSKTCDDNSIHNFTQIYSSKLEDIVRKHAGQYFWTHRRWKTKQKKENQIVSGTKTVPNIDI